MNPGTDDLLVGPAYGLVSVHAVFAAWRRARRLVAVLAVAGLLAGLGLAIGRPHARAATTSLLLQYPSGVDQSQAVQTDLSLLQTRAVASSAQRALGLHMSAASFAASYEGKVLSDAVLQITARAADSAEAVRRANALAKAFLRFRQQTYDYQLTVVEGVLQQRVQALQDQLTVTNGQIASADTNPNRVSTPGAPSLSDLLAQRAAQQSDIDQIQNQIEGDVLATATVVAGSHVIDAAAPVAFSMPRTALADVLTGLVAALALALGGVTLAAVVSTRPIRRADVAATLDAPVLVSVGRLRPRRWRRLVRRKPPLTPDMTLVVRHLVGLLKSATTEPPALVVVAVGDVEVAAAAVEATARKLDDDGFDLTVVNETGSPLARSSSEGAADRARGDGIVVLAALAPARGAEHLREWASDAVVVVTAGRASATTLRSNATMIQSAGLKLRSVVLVGSDPEDDSLGAVAAPARDEHDGRRADAGRRNPKSRVP